FGDGDGDNFVELARCQDVATHELGHGLINATANLTYQFQSGALNEHYADVFGWLHDQEDDGIGEDCIGPARSTALRDMCNPGAVDDPQPADMSQYLDLPNTESGDFGGVHINSGIPNRAACLTRARIGGDSLSRIWYQTLRFHLGPTSDFATMVDATLAACATLAMPGATCTAVAESWAQVGLDSGVAPPAPIDCPTNSSQVGNECYCDSGYASTPDGEGCIPEQVAECPSNSHREGTVCVCDECFQGLPDQNGTGCQPIPNCTVCDNPLETSGPSGCECIPGIDEVCGPRSLEFVTEINGERVTGETCCRPDDPCGWGADGFCDCFGECGWNATDCSNATPTAPECGARVAGDCGNENWAGRCAGSTLIYCDNQTDPSVP
ncbi:MAG: M4 family metallopeptidase, partial [Myxococcota bacterium]